MYDPLQLVPYPTLQRPLSPNDLARDLTSSQIHEHPLKQQKMARYISQRSRILTLERRLGFLTERGLSRTRSDLLPPEVLRMNASIDEIKKEYHTLTKEELVSSKSFDQAWRDLLFELKCLWPESVEQEGCVLDPELYSQPLVFHKAEDFLK